MNKVFYGKLIFECSSTGRRGYDLPENTFGKSLNDFIPATLQRQATLVLPEADEQTVARHYTNMSNNNFGVDTGFYPLGSCTMKYNPKINEEVAAHPAFTALHPAQPAETIQGALHLYDEVQRTLAEIAGMSAEDFAKAWAETELEDQIKRSLIQARLDAGLTQKQLAERSGIRQPNISRIENGTTTPTIQTLNAIAKGSGKKLKITFE